MARSYDIAEFNHSDGFTPIQTRKLNQNFDKIVRAVSGIDEGSESGNRMERKIQDKLIGQIMDMAYPVGSLIFAKDSDSLPKWGKWREVTFGSRFVRLGTSYGSTGGSSSQTVSFQLPKHKHKYMDTALQFDKVIGGEPPSGNDREYPLDLEEYDTTSETEDAGEGTATQTQTISTIPPYFTIMLFERYE